jgi:YD repeat-containing protein
VQIIASRYNGIGVAWAASILPIKISDPWNTTTSTDGTHTLRSLAYDAVGNVGTSTDANVNVQNNVAVTTDTTPPTAQITSPANGATVGRNLKVYTAANDNVGVVRVELYLDQALNATSSSSSTTFNLNTSKWSKGVHTLQLLAFDVAGNAGSSAMVNVSK